MGSSGLKSGGHCNHVVEFCVSVFDQVGRLLGSFGYLARENARHYQSHYFLRLSDGVVKLGVTSRAAASAQRDF